MLVYIDFKMSRKVNFKFFLLMTALTVINLSSALAQDGYRLSRPTDKYEPIIEPSPQTQSNFNNANQSTVNDNQSVRVNIPPTRLNNPSTLGGSVSSNTLTQAQIQKLAAHDIVLLIDKSGSMATADCPTNGSNGLKTILPGLLFGGNFTL